MRTLMCPPSARSQALPEQQTPMRTILVFSPPLWLHIRFWHLTYRPILPRRVHSKSAAIASEYRSEARHTLYVCWRPASAIFGHVHNSQRFLLVNNSVADPAKLDDPKAPMYIIAGGAGHIEGLTSVGGNFSTNVFAYADDFSYGKISFLDANNLKVEFIRSSTGDILDSSVLFKSHKQQFFVQ